MPERLATKLEGVVLVEPVWWHGDERGFMVKTSRRDAWEELGVDAEFVQQNHSRSSKGTLRGLHFQTEPGPGEDSVRCARGAILDVAVDLHSGWPTLGSGRATSSTMSATASSSSRSASATDSPCSATSPTSPTCSRASMTRRESGIAWDDPMSASNGGSRTRCSPTATARPRAWPRWPTSCHSSTREGQGRLPREGTRPADPLRASDLLRGLRSGSGDLVPPRGLFFVGEGDFFATGRESLDHFTELGGLEATDRVLDIGCGIGRMAIPLAGCLDAGSYAGFDVSRTMIRWCRRNITPRHPGFELEWAPIHNAKYNPFGTISATEFRFPYPDSSFDFAFATSLFTHLVRDEVRHYLGETARVLKPGGSCLLTFFLLTPRAEAEIADGAGPWPSRTRSRAAPRPIPASRRRRSPSRSTRSGRCSDEAGLAVVEPIHFGRWANEPGGAGYQDIVIARRA